MPRHAVEMEVSEEARHDKRAVDEDAAANSGVPCPEGASLMETTTSTWNFSSGSPGREATRGVVHLFNSSEIDGDCQHEALPAGRRPHLCVLGVPNHVTGADFCVFAGSFISNITEVQLIRTEGVKDRYCALLKLDTLESADAFCKDLNGKKFTWIEDDVCKVMYVANVQCVGDEDQSSAPAIVPAEPPNCPVCLERLDQQVSGVLTTLCNHSFHTTCISQWRDSSCPVCRYKQQQSETSICSICGASESLWICVVCGFVGCGRYQAGHAENHYKLTNHCYSLELETQRVWDYVGDGYVHRLIQSKTGGKVVEVPSPCQEGSDDRSSSYGWSKGAEYLEAITQSKIESISYEYNHLLTTQLESQREYFEREMTTIEERTANTVEASFNQRLQKLHRKMDDKLQARDKEKRELEQINEALSKDQMLLRQKLKDLEASHEAQLKQKDAMIADLEEQVRDYMIHIQAQQTVAKDADAKDTRDGTILPLPSNNRAERSGKPSKRNPRKK